MPHQTLPIFFNFHLSAIISSPLSNLHQEEADMESVDAVTALKSSFRPEMEGMKTTPHHHHHPHHHHQQQQQQQSLNDEVFGAEELDGFLDFSNEDVNEFFSEENQEEEKEEEEEEEEEAEKEWSCDSVLSTEDAHLGKTLESNSKNDFEPQLCVPTDDLAQLEWLSHFVEDSFSKFPSFNDSVSILRETPIPDEGQKSDNSSHSTQTESKENRTGCLALTMETPVPAKARSKRSRTGGRVWFNKTHFTESSPTSSSSSSPSSSSSSSSSFLQSSPSSCLIFANTAQNQGLFDFLGKPPGKKPKKEKKRPPAASDTTQLQPQRRCSHCLVQKTPQWRTGPLGAKTLCNACGVRYKSGRLLPEYRPAGSPTFLSNVHSNSHRKVLEMRRKKEVAGPEPGLVAVQSF